MRAKKLWSFLTFDFATGLHMRHLQPARVLRALAQQWLILLALLPLRSMLPRYPLRPEATANHSLLTPLLGAFVYATTLPTAVQLLATEENGEPQAMSQAAAQEQAA